MRFQPEVVVRRNQNSSFILVFDCRRQNQVVCCPHVISAQVFEYGRLDSNLVLAVEFADVLTGELGLLFTLVVGTVLDSV